MQLEGGRYVGLILLGPLVDILAGCRPGSVGDSSSDGGGGLRSVGKGSVRDRDLGSGDGEAAKTLQVGAYGGGGGTRAQVHYSAQLLALSLQDGDNFHTLLMGTVLPILHNRVLCKNWYL